MSTKAERYVEAVERAKKEEATFEIIDEVKESPTEKSEREYRERMSDPARVPEWAKPASNDATAPVPGADATSVDPALIESAETYQAAATALGAAHTKAAEALGEQHKRELYALLTARRNKEAAEQAAAEKALPNRLKDALASMAEAKATDATALARAEVEDDAASEQKLRDRVAPALAVADAVYSGLHLWASGHKQQFDAINEMERDELLVGLPASTPKEQQASVTIVASLQGQVSRAINLYNNALQTLRNGRQAIEQVIKHGRLHLGFYELQREINQAVHETSMASVDTVDSLNAAAKSVALTLERLVAMKKSVAGVSQPPILTENKRQILDVLSSQPQHDKSEANAAWDPTA